MPRSDAAYDELAAAPWLRAVIMPLLLFAVVVAVVCGLVLSGALQGHKVYESPSGAPTTQPTVIIQP